jgi:tetratricopeptide (TPR) repeat protein
MRVQMGEEDEVAPALREFVDNKHPETLLILETLSRAFMQHLRYGPAFNHLSRWIREAPEAAKPWCWRGWVCERLNDSVGAMRDYQRAVELDPDFTAARLRLAELWLEKSNPMEALMHLERLREQHPDRPDIMARLGECYFLQGESEKARSLLGAAVKELPEDPSLLVHLGKLDLQAGRPAEAEQWLRRMLKIDPYSLEAQFALVECLRIQDRPEEATAEYALYEKNKAQLNRTNELLTAEADHPNNDPAKAFEIGTSLLQMKQNRQGEFWLQKALERDPRHQPSLRALADYYERTGDRDAAAACRRRLAKLDDKTPTAATNAKDK